MSGMSDDNARGRVFVGFSWGNGWTKFDETLKLADIPQGNITLL